MTTMWNLDGFFPEFNGVAYHKHMQKLEKGLERMDAMARDLERITEDNVELWAQLFVLDEELMALFSHLAAYVACLSAADATNEDYKAAEANVSRLGAGFTKAFAPVMAALREVEDAPFNLLLALPALDGAQYVLKRLRRQAGWSLEPELEILAADLGVDGIHAWGRLYDNMSARLAFPMPTPDGGEEQVPMAMKRSLLEDQDAEVRRMALERSNQAWEEVEHVAAAALNAISGTRLSLYAHRGFEDYLEEPFFDAKVRRETVEAMWRAVEANQETAVRIMNAKAACLGKERLGFQDLYCPVPQAESARYTWDQALALVRRTFEREYPGFAAFVDEMLEQGRVESEKRPGKRPGAFCTTSLLSRDSYVYMSFGGGMGDVQTLAHELGHAFHGRCLREERVFASRYPMTLAETASTFAERLLQDAILAEPNLDDKVKLGVLTARCNDAVTFMCDIRMRYEFEKAFYQERMQGEVSVRRIKELQLATQQRCFCDSLHPEQRDPLFWASKLHFYITGVSFYNFPYTFGFLFSLSLAEQLRRQGPDFLPRYEDLLRLTGSAECEEVVHHALGRDITQEAFWQQALDRVAADAAVFEELVRRVL